MTAWTRDFMPRDGYLIGLNIGEAVAKLARERWPRDTAKHIERKWDVDPATAKNITRGHVSERTITKAVKAEGWELLEALGHAMTGVSYLTWKQQELEKVLREVGEASNNVQRLRTSAASLAGAPARHDGADYRAGSASRRTG